MSCAVLPVHGGWVVGMLVLGSVGLLIGYSYHLSLGILLISYGTSPTLPAPSLLTWVFDALGMY
ncbi:hypothetical protein BDN70DRAFT_888209 [Pholiota conissans]|uniref:Uncharacterized protein n=1 Tax=Pholiota conissans TaxID=109636 RepID=A0A9P5YP50_9AGAR|nr:hypothetical protein BDN70DRAFT_888209 [Pholiota conissans]